MVCVHVGILLVKVFPAFVKHEMFSSCLRNPLILLCPELLQYSSHLSLYQDTF
jgi:hypothetical protein